MFIQVINSKRNNKVYTSKFLTESYRQNGKVKHRVLANLSKVPEDIINNINAVIKRKQLIKIEDLKKGQGKNCGGLLFALEIAKRLGIVSALGNSRNAKITLLQIFARIFTQGSQRNIINNWINNQAVEEILKIEDLKLDDLYKNLDYLSENQTNIEKKIFKLRTGDSEIKTIYLYDVTSSYLEGTKNELADYGYNRDKKIGKMQIVIGLLCDQDGYPVSIEVFKGNTSDTSTVCSQLEKLDKKFGVKNVIFVGDKGMIKYSQIEHLNSENYRWKYITSITKAQIKTLIKENVIQLSMFDEKLCEVQNEDMRYILRRNPVRATEIQLNRNQKLEKIKQKIELKNLYLQQHPKAKDDTAVKEINEQIKKYKFNNQTLNIEIENRKITLNIDTENYESLSELDGCYVIKTDVITQISDIKTIHNRYKDLAQVESAFRTIKTGLEEIRPIYFQTENHTRGHVFICMLAYMIAKYVRNEIKNTVFTLKSVFDSMDNIQYSVHKFENAEIKLLPTELLTHQIEIIEKFKIKLPANL